MKAKDKFTSIPAPPEFFKDIRDDLWAEREKGIIMLIPKTLKRRGGAGMHESIATSWEVSSGAGSQRAAPQELEGQHPGKMVLQLRL